MNEFVLLFRLPVSFDPRKASSQEVQNLRKKWHDWAGSIAAQGKLSNNGIRLAPGGKVLKSGGVITDGPFVEIREMLASFIVVKAESLDEAITLAHGCPAVDQGGSVEIRPVYNQAAAAKSDEG